MPFLPLQLFGKDRVFVREDVYSLQPHSSMRTLLASIVGAKVGVLQETPMYAMLISV